nr:DUF423 domain-containing protein [Pseudomonas aeruginosa]
MQVDGLAVDPGADLAFDHDHGPRWRHPAQDRDQHDAGGQGILLFSGSLYLLTLSGIGKLGIVTPFGGVSFLAGWLCLGLAAWRLGNA